MKSSPTSYLFGHILAIAVIKYYSKAWECGDRSTDAASMTS